MLNIVEGEPLATAENAKPYFEGDLIDSAEVLVGESFSYTLPEPQDFEGEEVQIIVDLGEAQSFLDYSERVFEIVGNSTTASDIG